MPKKTKKQKIIAQYRKKLKLLSDFSNTQRLEKKDDLQKEDKNEKVENLTLSTNNNLSSDNLNKKYFLKDFKKSILLIVFIIALEIGLYFVKLIK